MTKLGVLLIIATIACRSKEPPPAARDRPGSDAAVGSGSVARPAEPSSSAAIDKTARNMTGLRPHQGANCPSSLPGAVTQLELTPRGVDVTVTSKDASVQRGIVALAERHVHGRTAEVSKPHDQRHGGPGVVGYCPVIVTDQTMVTMTPIPGGVTLHVEARTSSAVPDIQEQVKARAARLPGQPSS